MELTRILGNTWCLTGEVCIPLYCLDGDRCVLIDTGSAAEGEALDAVLAGAGLTPAGILCTHMHYDHNGSTQRLRRKWNIPAAMPRGEAELCRTQAALRSHLYVFPPALVAGEPILTGLVGPIDRSIEPEEETLSWCGAEFGILHTPGHSPDHICITTPDGVCCLGDCLLTRDVLAASKLPYAFDVGRDLETKRALRGWQAPVFLLSHRGAVRGPLTELADANAAAMEGVLDLMAAQVAGPMTAGQIYAALYLALGLRTNHPVKAAHQERYARPYLDRLTETGRLSVWAEDGVVWYGPGKR